MAHEKLPKLTTDEKNQRAKQQTIKKYKKQERWLGWVGAAILVLILFLVLSVGYATDWGQNGKGTLRSATMPAPNSSLNDVDGNKASTTKEIPSAIKTLLDDTKLGESIHDLLSRAQGLGISSDCVTNILLVQTCVFKVGDSIVTTKNLIMNGLLSSVNSNF